MRALHKKLWRELWNMRLQAAAIALVIVGGVAMFIMSLSTLDSLFETRERFYRQNHFAHVFAGLVRAPESLASRLAEIPGVDKVETRVLAYVSVDVSDFPDPVSAHLLSLPDHGPGLLNQLYLRRGRLFEPGSSDEVVVSEEFALAHGLEPGDSIHATIRGRRERLVVVGHVLSPEYIYQIAPGAVFPDNQRYGVMWMARTPLAAAFGMEGAFNDVSLTLSRDAQADDVIRRLDQRLAPYGGTGAITREDQLSHRFLSEELKQQKTIATVFPAIFFGVAAFLLNVVVSRLISLEREQVATLKAFGYSNLAVGLHYSSLVLMIVTLGIAGGIGTGIWMGKSVSDLYMAFYSFPYMIYVLRPGVIVAAAAICIAVAVAGTLHAVRQAARLPPAQGMRPEPPNIYRATLLERMGLQHRFTQSTRMILRSIERRPLRALLTVLGIAMACGVMMIGNFQESAIDRMVAIQYGLSQRENLLATFVEATPERSLYSLRGLPGVQHAEGFRGVPATLRFGHRSYRTALQGIEPDGSLLRLLDADLRPIELPAQGVVLTDYLADLLRIAPGDLLTVEVLEGRRPVLEVPVVGLSSQYLGVYAYTRRETLNELLREGPALSGALLSVDSEAREPVFSELKRTPRIAGVVERKAAIRAFYDTLADTILYFTFIATLLGGSIAFGVVYNSMRIALSERSRELASLRVLGFTHGEIAYILLGELGLLMLPALPLGFLFGYGLCAYLAFKFDTDLYRVPLVMGADVLAFAAAVVVGSFALSAVLIWRNLGRLDMVAVLKSKE